MTNTETKFRLWAKKEFPGATIKKIPDYKMLGNRGAVGLPDYVIFYLNFTLWFEVKSAFGNTITLRHFTDGQKVTFNKMMGNNVDVFVYCFTRTKGNQMIRWQDFVREGGKHKFR